jgi:hypothetical protein
MMVIEAWLSMFEMQYIVLYVRARYFGQAIPHLLTRNNLVIIECPHVQKESLVSCSFAQLQTTCFMRSRPRC